MVGTICSMDNNVQYVLPSSNTWNVSKKVTQIQATSNYNCLLKIQNWHILSKNITKNNWLLSNESYKLFYCVVFFKKKGTSFSV